LQLPQALVHAPSQQKPSTQLPLTQLLAARHAPPSSSFGTHWLLLQYALAASQSKSPTQLTGQVAAEPLHR
jgi:hypothetical protein